MCFENILVVVVVPPSTHLKMYAWMIGCSTHGISGEMLSKVKDALNLMNDITSNGVVRDDFYQAPDFACTFTRSLRDLNPYKGRETIWLVTTGYKIRQAHDEAIEDLVACKLPSPIELDYSKAKKAAKDVKYTCNGIDNKFTGWGKHTPERIDEAWATLENEAVEIGRDQWEAMKNAKCGCRLITYRLFEHYN